MQGQEAALLNAKQGWPREESFQIDSCRVEVYLGRLLTKWLWLQHALRGPQEDARVCDRWGGQPDKT